MGSRDDEEPMLDAKHGLPELPWMEAGLCGSIIIARARRSCFVYAGRDSLIARSDRLRPRYVPDLEWLLAVQSKIINQKSSMAPRSRADGDHTGIHANPALQTAASVTAVFSSLLYGQTSGQECVLHRATSATEADMRRRPSLPIRWMHHCRRLFIALAESSCVPFDFSLHEPMRFEAVNIKRRVLVSPDETFRLRSL